MMRKIYSISHAETFHMQTSSIPEPVFDHFTCCSSAWKRACCFSFLAALIFAIGFTVGTLLGTYAINLNNLHDMRTHLDTPGLQPSNDKVQGRVTENPIETSTTNQNVDMSTQPECHICTTRNPFVDDGSEERSLFSPLSVEEITSVYDLFQKEGMVSDPLMTGPEIRSDYITNMYLWPPNKVEALAFLDEGGTSPRRFAKVHLVRGAGSSPDLMEYKVGPLGSGEEDIRIEHLSEPGEIDFDRRTLEENEYLPLGDLMTKELLKLKKLMEESFDGAFIGQGINYHIYLDQSAAQGRKSKLFVALDGMSTTMHVLPLTASIYHPGNNLSSWYVFDYYYLNQGPFKAAEDLMEAYNDGSLRKIKLPTGHRSTLIDDLPRFDKNIPYRENSNIVPPRTYQQQGPRYTIRGHVIDWMGWSMEYSVNQIRGPAIFNVKFKGQRIIYELSLNDINLLYTSGSAGAGRDFMALGDSTYRLGNLDNPIMGIDCPEHATVLNTTGWEMYSYQAFEKPGLCVFESDGEEAVWRHRSYGKDGYYGGLRESYLIVRYPIVVGNYDYTIEFRFLLDGQLFTQTSSTGYLYTSFWDPEDPNVGPEKSYTPFGFRVRPYAIGAIHDHTFGFKLDMDIIDRDNSFDIVHWKAGDVVTALKTQVDVDQVPPYFLFNVTRYLEYETLQKEGGFVVEPKKHKIFSIVNEKYRNKWGVKKGYRIIPLSSDTEILPHSHPVLSALSYLKYHCAVTKHHDSEQTISESIYDLNRLGNPMGSLDRYLNDESVVNSDIVTWLAVRFFHLPTAEDVPMTASVRTGFLLKPYNFFDSTAIDDIPNEVRAWDEALSEEPPRAETCSESYVK